MRRPAPGGVIIHSSGEYTCVSCHCCKLCAYIRGRSIEKHRAGLRSDIGPGVRNGFSAGLAHGLAFFVLESAPKDAFVSHSGAGMHGLHLRKKRKIKTIPA